MFWAKKLSGIWSNPITPEGSKSFDKMPSTEFLSASVCDCSPAMAVEERARSEDGLPDFEGVLGAREVPDLEKGKLGLGEELPDFEEGDFGRGEEIPDLEEGDFGRGEEIPDLEKGKLGLGEELPDFEGGKSASTEEMPSFFERMISDGDFEKAGCGAPGLRSFPPLRNRAVSLTESSSGSEADPGSLQEKEFTRHATRYAERHETASENIRTTDADWLRATATLLTLQARIFERTPLRNRLLMLAMTLHDAKARLAPTLSWNVFYQGCRSLGVCIRTGELSGAALSDRLRACPERRVSLWHLRRPELLIVRRTCLCRV
jgi:hypothetical protein